MLIIDILKEVTDKRSISHVYNLSSVLGLVLLGRLCGLGSLAEIHRYGLSLRKSELLRLGFCNGRFICYSNLTIILQKVCPDSLEKSLTKIISYIDSLSLKKSGKLLQEEGRLLAIDGKRIKNSKDGNAHEALHLVSLFSKKIRGVFNQTQSEYGGGEIHAALTLISEIPIEDRIFTGDAIFASPQLCKKIIEKRGDYIFTVKKNQGKLYENLECSFQDIEEDKNAKIFVEPAEKSHGIITEREITILPSPCESLRKWPSINTVAKIKRVRVKKKNGIFEREESTAFLISSIKNKPPEFFLKANRGHWSIENLLHRNRDLLYHEDQSTIRKNNSPQISAAISNLAITLAFTIGHSLKYVTEQLHRRPNLALQLIRERIK